MADAPRVGQADRTLSTTVVLNRCRDRLCRRKVAGFFGLSGDDELHSIADDLPEALAVSREELNLVQPRSRECL